MADHNHHHMHPTMDATTGAAPMAGMESTTMDHSQHHHGGSGHDMHDMEGMHGNMSMHGMMMYFHTGFTEYVLFKDLYTETKGAMAGACVVIFVIAVLYEGLKVFREHLLQRHLSSLGGPGSRYETKGPAGGNSREQIVMQSQDLSISSRMLSCGHFVQTLLHIIQVFVSYCLMLVFMTYNVWLCLAVVLGAGVGYFLFGWRRAVVVDSNEHCH